MEETKIPDKSPFHKLADMWAKEHHDMTMIEYWEHLYSQGASYASIEYTIKEEGHNMSVDTLYKWKRIGHTE